MKRQIAGLDAVAREQVPISDGAYLVRVERAKYRWDSQKPFLELKLEVLGPPTSVDGILVGRIYCTPKALWKLNWFLRDFEYDRELFHRNEIDEKSVEGLIGIVRTHQRIFAGRSYLNFEAFANQSEWKESSSDRANAVVDGRARL